MKIKTFYLIFLIFSQNFVDSFKGCEVVVVNRNEYDFSSFDRGEANTLHSQKNNKIIFAFDYRYILMSTYISNLIAKLNYKSQKIADLERQKFSDDLIVFSLTKLWNFISEEEPDKLSDYINDTDIKELNKRFNLNPLNESIKKYKNIKEEKSSISSAFSITSIITSIASTISFGYKYVSSWLTTAAGETSILKASKFIVSKTGITITASALIIISMKLYNIYCDSQIRREKNTLSNEILLYKLLIKKIKKAEWVDNNVVLSATSADENCPGYDILFDFYKGINYRDGHGYNNNYNVMFDMANLTCTFRQQECKDIEKCIYNLMKFLKYKIKQKNKKTKFYQAFMDDCSIKKFPYYD